MSVVLGRRCSSSEGCHDNMNLWRLWAVDGELVRTVGFSSSTRSTKKIRVTSCMSLVARSSSASFAGFTELTRDMRVLLDLHSQARCSECVKDGQFKTPASLAARLPPASTETSPRAIASVVMKSARSFLESAVQPSSVRPPSFSLARDWRQSPGPCVVTNALTQSVILHLVMVWGHIITQG